MLFGTTASRPQAGKARLRRGMSPTTSLLSPNRGLSGDYRPAYYENADGL